MIASMTGYGKGAVQDGSMTIEAEIKSLNSRFLDLSLRLPRNLMNKELEIREKIRTKIRRGKVYLSITVKKGDLEQKYSSIDPEGVKYVVGLLKDIKKTAKIKDKVTLVDILSFQNMIFEENGNEAESEMPLVEKAINLAIEDMEKMRNAEGSELEKDLRKRVKIIEDAVTKIESTKDSSIKEYFEKLRERAKQLVNDITDNPDRLNMELALISERYDITEECVRLRSHIKIFLQTLNSSEDAGRRLNFILQEMNREANTINSKSINSEVSHLGIVMKEEIEKIREQIQNIE